MPTISLKNSSDKTVYAFQYVRPVFQIADYVKDAVEFATGIEELKLALVSIGELPAAIETIEDLFKYFKYLYKIRKKTVEVKEGAEEIANEVFSLFTHKAIPIEVGDQKNILDQSKLSYLTPSGIAELFGARVITVVIMSDEGNLGLQYQTAVDTEWEVVQSGVRNSDDTIQYRWHGQGQHLPIPLKWRPAMVSYEDQLYLVGRGENSSVWWSAWNGNSWSYPIHIHGIRTKQGVSMTVWKEKIYATWISIEVNKGPQISSFDGASWTNIHALADYGSSHTPAIAVTPDNELYLSWKGINKDEKIWSSLSGNGIDWSPQQVQPNALTTNSPFLLNTSEDESAEGTFIIGWKGAGKETKIYYIGNYGNKIHNIEGAATSTSPAMTSSNMNEEDTTLYAAWKNPGNNTGISFSSRTFTTQNVSSWNAPIDEVPGAATDDGPALVRFEGVLYLAWKDNQISHSVRWSRHVDGAWSSPQTIE